MDKCSGWNVDRSLKTELALKDVYNKEAIFCHRVSLSHRLEKEKERKMEKGIRYQKCA